MRWIVVTALAAVAGACAPQTIIANNHQAVVEAWSHEGAVAQAEKECGTRGRWPLLQRQIGGEYWFACQETDEAIAARQKAQQEEALERAMEMRRQMASATAAPAPAESTPATLESLPAMAPRAGGAWVQLGAFRDRQRAEKYLDEVRRVHGGLVNGHDLVVAEADLGARGTFHLARLGPYAETGEAKRACRALKDGGATCFVLSQR